MNRKGAVEQARRGRLYPGVILHGGEDSERMEFALELARTLLCELEPQLRPCTDCRHCRRIQNPDDSDSFHPDFVVLGRDLKTSTSVDAVKNMLRTAQVSPFEARGQVFVLRSAESLTGGAANALLKNLEEPALTAPRHFLLLTPSAVDLLPTLRSRSLSIYLGQSDAYDEDAVLASRERFEDLLRLYLTGGSPVLLLAMARVLAEIAPSKDARDTAGLVLAARSLMATSGHERMPPPVKRALLALAEEILLAGELRLRGIQPLRILEGLVAKHLAAVAPPRQRGSQRRS
ncbi:MAG: hypothetical protein AAGA81_11090 [Acidobacteriota bacterium]